MGLIDGFLSGLLGPLGKKAAQWIPSKEEIIRRKIRDYEKQLKELELQKWTPVVGREHDRIDKLLQLEKENLDRYLAANK